MNRKKIFWCANCLNMSTRPRISFDDRGWCNACQWMEEKSKLDWSGRQRKLDVLLDNYRSGSGYFDCVVPVSGGKDGSYVAYNLKYKYGMNPLAVTVRPALSLDVGNSNLFKFIQSGFTHIHVSTNPIVLNMLNKYGFREKGFPYYGWLIAIMTAVIRLALNMKIPLVFYGEDGEIEYGGSTVSKDNPFYDIHYMKDVYLEGGHDQVLDLIKQEHNVSEADLCLFKFPSELLDGSVDMKFTHWSYFENWDPYRNYLIAKEHCGLQEKQSSNNGTFTNFSQNDQALYELHAYMMYLKFGFGRATQDAGIEIRRGAMTREQAINLVKMYDSAYPHDQIQNYLDYYGMDKDEFDSVLDRHVNKDLFKKRNGVWEPIFTVAEAFDIEMETV